jgi:hypothetical protein
MGILVSGNFCTAEGFQFTSFYNRITTMNVYFSGTNLMISINASNFLSRESFTSGKNSINVLDEIDKKQVPTSYNFSLSKEKFETIPIVSYMYYLIINAILSNNNCEAVLENGQNAYVPSSDLVYVRPSE